MDWYGEEKDVAPAVEALGKDAVPALRTLATLSPYCGDAGFNCWTPSDLNEIANRLESK